MYFPIDRFGIIVRSPLTVNRNVNVEGILPCCHSRKFLAGIQSLSLRTAEEKQRGWILD